MSTVSVLLCISIFNFVFCFFLTVQSCSSEQELYALKCVKLSIQYCNSSVYVYTALFFKLN